MGQEQENCMYLMASDPDAVARANRRVQTILFTILASFVTIGVWAWWGNPPDGIRPGLPLVATLWAGGILVSLLCFGVRGMVKGGEAAIGADFLTASMPASGGGMTIVEYKDIRTVNLGLSKDRIVEIGIRVGGLTTLSVQHVQDPAIAVRAIFEWGPAHVKWRRLRWPWTRMTRDEVRALIDQADLPNMDTLLPPGAIWARVDNVFVRQANGRLSDGGSPRSTHVVRRGSRSPASRYVNFMLQQMIETGSKTQVLRRSEPLPTLTLGTDTAEPAPLDEVLAHLKTMRGLDPARTPGTPIEATLPINVQRTPYTFLFRFNDTDDDCCEIRLADKIPTPERR